MTEKEKKLERYRKANQTAIQGETVFAGSSLMEMFPVEKLLQEAGSSRIIYNRGVGGFVSEELWNALDICILDLKPSRLFINIGTNDLSDASIPLDRMIETYDKIITAVEESLPDIEIYLMAYYPVNYEAADESMTACLRIRTNEKIALANEKTAALAFRHHQKYIDVNQKLKDGQGRLKAEYTIEGMHINEDGYRAIFADIMSYVNEPKWRA